MHICVGVHVGSISRCICACVCVCKRERERESVCVCMCVCIYDHLCQCAHVCVALVDILSDCSPPVPDSCSMHPLSRMVPSSSVNGSKAHNINRLSASASSKLPRLQAHCSPDAGALQPEQLYCGGGANSYLGLHVGTG